MNFLAFREQIYDWTLANDENVTITFYLSFLTKSTNSHNTFFKHKKISMKVLSSQEPPSTKAQPFLTITSIIILDFQKINSLKM